MRKLFPMMIDRPETPHIISSVFYCILAFWTLPFLLLLFMQGSFHNPVTLAWGDIAYHIINFIMALVIFRNYLAESFLNVQADLKHVLTYALTAAALMCTLMMIFMLGYLSTGAEILSLAAFSTLPIAEVELFVLSSEVIYQVPLWGTLCMVILTPVSISCLYYATAFAPGSCNKPWLGYLLVALILAFPRVCNAVTYWDPMEELQLYLIQLPLHLFACWSYQQADTVWAPIISLSVTNLAAILFLFLLF